MFAECNDYFLRFTMFNNGVVYKRSELIIFILHSLKADYKLDHNILSAIMLWPPTDRKQANKATFFQRCPSNKTFTMWKLCSIND